MSMTASSTQPALKRWATMLYFVNWDDLDGRQFGRMFHVNAGSFVDPVLLEDFDLIWVYQMEGFYADRARFLRMIEIFEDACPLVVNDPRTIRHNLGKHYLWELQRHGVRVIPTYRVDETICRRLTAGTPFVLKPVFGDRGNSVFLARAPADLESDHGYPGPVPCAGVRACRSRWREKPHVPRL